MIPHLDLRDAGGWSFDADRIERLIVLLEHSDRGDERARYLREISALARGCREYFPLFEQYAVSDNDMAVRLTATRIVVYHYPKEAPRMMRIVLECVTSLRYALGLYHAVWDKKLSLRGAAREAYQSMEDAVRDKLESTGVPLEVWESEWDKMKKQMRGEMSLR